MAKSTKVAIKGTKVIPTPPPAGIKEVETTITDVPIENEVEERYFAKYRSVDGHLYKFRTHDKKGKALPYRENMAMFLCFSEIGKGGNPLPIMKAFKVELIDANNKTVYSWK
jgi:hypothetical protein